MFPIIISLLFPNQKLRSERLRPQLDVAHLCTWWVLEQLASRASYGRWKGTSNIRGIHVISTSLYFHNNCTRRPWTFPSPSTVLRRRFLDPTEELHLAGVIRWIPRSPSAASAAGGRGIPVSCPVYSVGALWLQVVGALEVEAWRLKFAGGGSPLRRRRSAERRLRSTANDALASPRRCCGRLPHGRLRGRRSLQIEIKKKEMWRIGSSAAALDGVGLPGPALGDFPLAWGLPPIQGFEGGSGDGAPPTATTGR